MHFFFSIFFVYFYNSSLSPPFLFLALLIIAARNNNDNSQRYSTEYIPLDLRSSRSRRSPDTWASTVPERRHQLNRNNFSSIQPIDNTHQAQLLEKQLIWLPWVPTSLPSIAREPLSTSICSQPISSTLSPTPPILQQAPSLQNHRS